MSCFWPVESELPRSWTGSSKPAGKDSIKSSTLTSRAAWRRCAFGDFVVAEANVFGDCSGEEERVLKNNGEVAAERGEILLAQVDAVEENGACGHIVEAHHQAGQGGFAGAGMAHDGDGLAGLDGEGDIFQNPLDVGDRGQFCGDVLRVAARGRPRLV